MRDLTPSAAALINPRTPPEPETCPYCGEPVPYVAVRAGNQPTGSFLCWRPGVCEKPLCRKHAEQQELEDRRQYQHQKMSWQRSNVEVGYDSCLSSRGLGEKYKHVKLDDLASDTPSMSAALDTARRYVRGFRANRHKGNGLFVCGPVGVGKTAIVAAIGNELEEAGNIGVLALKERDVMRNLTDTWGRHTTTTESQVMALYTNSPLLIVDDVGSVQTEQAVRELYVILDSRDAARRPTILASSYDLATLCERWTACTDAVMAASMADRTWRMQTVTIVGPNRRILSETAQADRTITEQPIKDVPAGCVLTYSARGERHE